MVCNWIRMLRRRGSKGSLPVHILSRAGYCGACSPTPRLPYGSYSESLTLVTFAFLYFPFSLKIKQAELLNAVVFFLLPFVFSGGSRSLTFFFSLFPVYLFIDQGFQLAVYSFVHFAYGPQFIRKRDLLIGINRSQSEIFPYEQNHTLHGFCYNRKPVFIFRDFCINSRCF